MAGRRRRLVHGGAAALIATVAWVVSPVGAAAAEVPCGASAGSTQTSSAKIAITRINPPIGSVAGGTDVAINGSGLDLVTAVRFGTVCTTQIEDRDSGFLYVTAPPTTTAGFVHIVAEGQGHSKATATDRFHYVPDITAISPSSGPPGTPITITGHGFTGARSVIFENDDRDVLVTSPVRVLSDNQVTTVAPATTLLHLVSVRVKAPGGTSMFGMYDRFTFT